MGEKVIGNHMNLPSFTIRFNYFQVIFKVEFSRYALHRYYFNLILGKLSLLFKLQLKRLRGLMELFALHPRILQ